MMALCYAMIRVAARPAISQADGSDGYLAAADKVLGFV